MQTQTLTHTLFYPRFHSFRRSDEALRYGPRQESELRRGLSTDQKFQVHHNETEDAIYKMDAIVRLPNAPLLPAVGIQFTTKPAPDKVNRTIAAVRRTRIVSRLLYLQAECPVNETAFPLITDLIGFLANSPAERGIICAVLTTDRQGNHWLRDLKCFPLETSATKKSQQKEEKAA